VWQFVMFPLVAFLLAKRRRAVSGRNNEYRRWKLLDVLFAEVASYLILLLVALVMTLVFDEQKIMYDPELCRSSDDCRKGPLRFSDVMSVNTSNGDSVTVYQMEGNSSGYLRDHNVTVLYTHGNSGNVRSFLPTVTYRNLLRMGVNVITWDPPGFGLSTGSPSFDAWMESAKIVLKRVLEMEPNVILYGRSLGGAVTTLLAAQNRFRGLILEAPLDSMPLLFHDFFKLTFFVMSPVWTDTYDAFHAIGSVNTCLFHYAAENDELITDYRQKRMNEQARNTIENCSLYLVGEGKRHNDVAWNNLQFENKLVEFIEKLPA